MGRVSDLLEVVHHDEGSRIDHGDSPSITTWSHNDLHSYRCAPSEPTQMVGGAHSLARCDKDNESITALLDADDTLGLTSTFLSRRDLCGSAE